MDKLQKFYSALIAAYPDVAISGEFTNAQIKGLKQNRDISIPGSVWQNKAGRGVFTIPSEYLNCKVKPDAVTPEGSPIELSASAVAVMHESAHTPVMKTPTTETFIPTRDPMFVPFGAYSDVEDIIKSRMFYPTYITGLSGNGKSSLVEQICAKHKREMIRVNLNALSDEEQLVGTKTLKDGNVEVVEGPVLIAMRRGAILLIDEIDAGSANSLLCLQSILEGKPYYFKLKNEVIIPTKGFNIIATANTKGKGNDNGQYIGTNILNEAFLERFGVTFEQEYPSAKIELKIILNLMKKLECLDESFASCLSKWADAIRRTYEAGGVDEIMSTRRIIHIVTAFSVFKNKKKSIELCCNRFDAQTKQAFMTMFDAVSPDESIPDEISQTEPGSNIDVDNELAKKLLGITG